ncbi:MAG TPA: hypothetical protein VGB78_00860, partial [Thermoplasmata archaeon]
MRTTVIGVLVAATLFFMIVMQGLALVAADTPTGYKFCTIMPAANNSTTQTIFPRFPGGVTSCPEVEAAGDSSTKGLSGGLTYHITTNDYLYQAPVRGNPMIYWSYFPDVGGLVTEYYPVYAMPGQVVDGNPDWEANTSDATIERVWMYAVFATATGTPGGYLRFSNDTGASWTYSYEPISTIMLSENITSWEVWTPALVRANNLSVGLDVSIPTGYSYSLDYLGLVIYWSVQDPNPQPGDIWGETDF